VTVESQDTVAIGPRSVKVWPDDVRTGPFDEQVMMAVFPDHREIAGPLIERILEVEAEERRRNPQASLGEGGQKVRDLDKLGVAAFELIDRRARRLFQLVLRRDAAVVDDCWANVFRDGEFTLPHAHKRTVASVVYALDPGDEDASAREPMNGLLMFAAPRMKACCRHKPEYVSTPAAPPMEPGAMVIFPAIYTHLVTPYRGTRPRISLAWNIDDHAVPGEVQHDGVLT